MNKFSYPYLTALIAQYLFNLNPKVFGIALKLYKFVLWSPRLITRKLTVYVPIPRSNERTIYLVTQNYSQVSLKGGISRVENYFYDQLTSKKHLPFRIIPVAWDGRNFVVVNENSRFKSQNAFMTRKSSAWNPSKDDLLFFQTFTLLNQFNESEIRILSKSCKIIVNIYDILPITDPQWFKDYMVHTFKRNFNLAWNYAELLIVNCAHTKSEIETYIAKNKEIFGNNSPQIKQVNLWSVAAPKPEISIGNHATSIQATNLFSNSDPILLLLSTVDPRKGHQELIRSAMQVWSEGVEFNLLFVGRLGWISNSFKSEFQEFLKIEKGRALWVSNVNDDELERYMSASNILISPSLGEGFGLPIAEALQRDLPVLANGIKPYKELFGSYVVLYGVNETFYSLTDALREIDEVITMGYKMLISNKFSNKDSLSELLESFENL